MRYVWVSGRVPKMGTHCAWCLARLSETGYLREMGTGLLYDDPECLELHAATAVGFILAKNRHEALAAH